MLRIAIAALLIVTLSGSGLTANPSDQAAAQEIIKAQLLAFRSDDAGAAFAFASPELQVKFGSPAVFMDMVKTGYAPVYRPKMVEFRDWIESPRGPEQQVFVIGPDGRAYIAHYMMERQSDDSWRISGCYLEPLGEESV
jgi:hypothetical protein